ncbi:MAG: transaldolase family protein [Candidatus Levyibacteriota bacterium]
MAKFLLDSGNPDEFREISKLAKKNKSEIWGATTNPTLIAKSASRRIADKKISQKKAFELQKQIVLEILNIVPGAVSAEVYADEKTKASEMIKQGKEIAKWHKRVVVKLPTTIEGFKARTELRKNGILINNTLVFSQQQVFAICLHEQIMQRQFGPLPLQINGWQCFISPFVGRLDDIGKNGMQLIENSMKMKNEFGFDLWLLPASLSRHVEYIKRCIELNAELLTAPAKTLIEWLSLSKTKQKKLNSKAYAKTLTPIKYWEPSDELLEIETINEFMKALKSNKLNIRHDLTDKGIIRFTNDWKSIIK